METLTNTSRACQEQQEAEVSWQQKQNCVLQVTHIAVKYMELQKLALLKDGTAIQCGKLAIINRSSEKSITKDPTASLLWTVKDHAHVENTRRR